jgi:PBP1b-binding outer membrane lipoprotein LpoB
MEKQLIAIWIVAWLFSGCISLQDKTTKKDSNSVKVSGDVTVSAIDRKGFFE